jgi:CRP/FNR family transcriptional regulator, cyclic AMP receptor protein
MSCPDEPESCHDELIEALRSEGVVCSLPSRTTLFAQGQMAEGIHIMSRGCVKLSISSCEGRVFILKVSERGEILGLHNCITGTPYEMTAQTLQSSRVSFVNRENLIRVLRHNQEASLAAAQQLARACHIAYDQITLLSASHSASEKVARFLLGVSAAPGRSKMGSNGAMPVELDLTHDDIAQAIGAARETVSRVLGSFRRQNLAILTGSLLLVQNRAGLEKIAGMGTGESEPAETSQSSRKRRPGSVVDSSFAARCSTQ